MGLEYYDFEELSEMISAEAVDQTEVFEVNVVSKDAKEAAEIASITLVDNNDKNLGTSVDLSQIGIFNTSTNNVVQNSNVKVLIKDVNGNVLDPNSVTLTPTSGNVFISAILLMFCFIKFNFYLTVVL